MKTNREIQVLATFVHGALASLHLLGLVYNTARGNKLDALAHTAAFMYDVASTRKHYKAVKNDKL